jgi:hypothetical protein
VALDGGFRVAWVESGTVISLPMSASGAFGAASAVNSSATSAVAVTAVACDTGVAYAWEGEVGTQVKHDVLVSLPGAAEQNLTSLAGTTSVTPAIAAAPAGSGFAVVYTQGGAPQLELLDATGAVTFSTSFTATFASAPTVVWDGTGFAAAWQDSAASGGSDVQFVSLFTDGGVEAGPVAIAPAPGTSENPRLVAGNGLLYLAWDDDRTGTAQAQVVRLDTTGLVRAGPTALDATTNPSLAPAPAFSGTNFALIWIGGGSASVDAKLTCF